MGLGEIQALFIGSAMHLLFLISAYLGAALSMLSAGLIGLSLLTSSSVSSSANAPPIPGETVSNQKTKIVVRPEGNAFRYGPEVNHGRSDTPVYATAQALREARASALPQNKPRRMYRDRIVQDSGAVTTGRDLSSGH